MENGSGHPEGMRTHSQQIREQPERPIVVRDQDVSALVAVLTGFEGTVRLRDPQGFMEFVHRKFKDLDLVSDDSANPVRINWPTHYLR